MEKRFDWQNFFNLPKVNWSLFALGILLILGGIALSPLPGPGGIFLIAPGLAFILKSSIWAKRHYVRIKRWQPRAGRWIDWGLRREAAKRKLAAKKAEKEAEAEAVAEAAVLAPDGSAN